MSASPSSDEAPPVVEPMALNKAQLRRALGISDVTIWRLEKRGLLKPVPGIRHKLYSVTAIRRFLDRGESAK